jgi:3-hydroxybutyryl-CoA dehydrogenase
MTFLDMTFYLFFVPGKNTYILQSFEFMRLLIVGTQENLIECKEKFGSTHDCIIAAHHGEAADLLDDSSVVFDFMIDENPEELERYADFRGVVFLNTVKITLAELMFSLDGNFGTKIFGFNGLPSLFQRSVLEVSVLASDDEKLLRQTCSDLKTDYVLVDDRVGLVTPRVICMIINEAYFTVQEKTATREDIDIAMKLGTNYPYGPFEWSKKIGLKNVFETLEAVYEDTKDERYKICPLLKKEYLKLDR